MQDPNLRIVAPTIGQVVGALRHEIEGGNQMVTAIEVEPCATPDGDAKFLLEAKILHVPKVAYEVHLAVQDTPETAEGAARFNMRHCHSLAKLAGGRIYNREMKTGDAANRAFVAKEQEFRYWAVVGGIRPE